MQHERHVRVAIEQASDQFAPDASTQVLGKDRD